jgi:small subunit ribosomal protein S21
MQVIVRDNNVDQALKALKRKLQREGVFRELRRQKFYEKPSEKRAREKSEAIRRMRKAAPSRAGRSPAGITTTNLSHHASVRGLHFQLFCRDS